MGTALLVAGLMMASTGANAAPPAQDSYVVVFDAGTTDARAKAHQLARQHGGEVGFVYEHALQGFSVRASARAAAAMANAPHVAYVEADRVHTIAAQSTPTGIDRTFATSNPNLTIDGNDDLRIDVDVAVIDTGVDLEHPDLNVVGGVNCASGGPFGGSCKAGGDDDHYHGTHVAGTIGAIDDGNGVVGIAPGARIHAVKVLNAQGSGYTSWIVAGIDWVAANAATIEVANMSLGGSGFSQAEYDAIQGAVNSGVAFAVAAGNDDADARNYSPAAFDNALTVSALADFDGAPGGLAAPTCRTDVDDTLADFSNWGPAVDIAAPGVCILSTFPLEQGSYGTISGTSMASPHAAGGLALLASANRATDAAGVHALYDELIAAGNTAWVDDSGDGTTERLLDVGDANRFAPATVAGGGSGGGGGEDLSLSVTAYKNKGQKYADLAWSGATSADVDVFRDGALIATTANDGAYTDGPLGKGGGTATYQVCEAGTATCSATVTATW